MNGLIIAHKTFFFFLFLFLQLQEITVIFNFYVASNEDIVMFSGLFGGIGGSVKKNP